MLPNYLTNGAYVITTEATLTSILVVAPGNITAGQLMMLASGTRGVSSTQGAVYNPPAGFVNQATVSRNISVLRVWTKTAVGTESSLTHTINVVGGGPGAVIVAGLYTFDSAADSIEGANTVSGSSTTVSSADVIVGGANRLAINVMFTVNGSTLTTTLGGTTGGSWVKQSESAPPPQQGHLILYASPQVAAVNITSGSAVVGGGRGPWLVWGAALYQTASNPTIDVTADGLACGVALGKASAAIPHGWTAQAVFGSPTLELLNILQPGSLQAPVAFGDIAIVVPQGHEAAFALGPPSVAIDSVYLTDENGRWSFAQYGDNVYATNYTDPIQVYSLGAGGTFADLGGDSPHARYLGVVKNFLVAVNTSDSIDGATPQRVRWSGLNQPNSWTVDATTQADYQDLLGDGGANQGIVVGLTQSDAVILQERSVWRMTYAGLPTVFTFDMVEGVRGTPAPGSIIAVGGIAYYLGEDGFYAFDGAQSAPIGQGRVDRTFLNAADPNYNYRISSVADVKRKLIFWSFANANANNCPNQIIVYNWGTGEWSLLEVETEFLWRTRSFGYSLEDLDAFGTLEELPAPLDARQWAGGAQQISAFDGEHQVAHFTGPSLAAAITTRELTIPDPRRFLLTETWPIVECPSAADVLAVAVGSRHRSSDSVSFATAVAMNPVGYCPQRAGDHYVRMRLSLTSSAIWQQASGIDIRFTQVGWR